MFNGKYNMKAVKSKLKTPYQMQLLLTKAGSNNDSNIKVVDWLNLIYSETEPLTPNPNHSPKATLTGWSNWLIT